MQEYWSMLPCPPSGDLPNPGIEPINLMSPALEDRFFATSTTQEALYFAYSHINNGEENLHKGFGLDFFFFFLSDGS